MYEIMIKTVTTDKVEKVKKEKKHHKYSTSTLYFLFDFCFLFQLKKNSFWKVCLSLSFTERPTLMAHEIVLIPSM